MASPQPEGGRLSKVRQYIAGAAWLYPFKGIYYFASNRFLWPLLRARLLPCLLLSVAVLTVLSFTYLPQVAFLAIFQGKLAFFNGVFLVLGEGAVIVQLLFEAFMVDETQVDVFDAVLVNEGLLDLVSPTRDINIDGADPLKMLGRPTSAVQYAPFSFRLIFESILFLPLNFIPVVGTPAFLILTGHRAGPFHHWRYFKLLALSRKERSAFVKHRRWKYTWFGTVALVLQLIPVLAMLFLLTTAAGAALWAVKLEEEREPSDQPDQQYMDDSV
ncbi:MAG: hypothetical protein M1832_004812 [Thelocarpon impressellum]|nr:MAG: hypothetical protein M1832_004812 [Thelocarpon impressellum]